MTEDEMVGWHDQSNGREFEQTQNDGELQESLLCCSPWSRKELDMTEQLNKNETNIAFLGAHHVCLLYTAFPDIFLCSSERDN